MRFNFIWFVLENNILSIQDSLHKVMIYESNFFLSFFIRDENASMKTRLLEIKLLFFAARSPCGTYSLLNVTLRRHYLCPLYGCIHPLLSCQALLCWIVTVLTATVLYSYLLSYTCATRKWWDMIITHMPMSLLLQVLAKRVAMPNKVIKYSINICKSNISTSFA